MKRYLALTLVLLFIVGILWGCGTASNDRANGEVLYESDAALKDEAGLSQSTSGSTTGSAPLNQKLVRKIWLNAETEDLDALLTQIDQRISELSGYVEEREVYNGSSYSSRRSRYANITIRIPVDKLDTFVAQVSEASNITSTNETADNITLSYIATQSRITALETEQSRLLELLAQAENMSDLLQIESRLTEVRTELEEVTSQLQLYDNMVNYGTIYLNLYEVREYTVTEEPETVWERIGSGFMESLDNLGAFFTELFVFVVVGFPYIAVIGVVVTVIVLLIRFRRKKPKMPIQTKQPEE